MSRRAIILLPDIAVRTKHLSIQFSSYHTLQSCPPWATRSRLILQMFWRDCHLTQDRNWCVEWRHSSSSTCIYPVTSIMLVLVASHYLELVLLLRHFTSSCLIKYKLYRALVCCDLRHLELPHITTCFNMLLDYELYVREEVLGIRGMHFRATKQGMEFSCRRSYIAWWPA